MYAITASNNGTLDATDVTVTDPTPAGLTFIGNDGACATSFPCALGTIPAGQSRQITTTFFVPPGYSSPNPISNLSTVTTTVADEDLTDNQATATTPVNAPTTDVSIRKIGPSSVTAGTSVSYTIVVGSSGPSDATSVVVSDVTPSGLTFVQNTGDCTTSFPCALGTIPAGQARTITAVFAVPLGYSGSEPDSQYRDCRQHGERPRFVQQQRQRDDRRESRVRGPDHHEDRRGRRAPGRCDLLRADRRQRRPLGRAGLWWSAIPRPLA